MKQRYPLYEHDPIHAGTQFLQLKIEQQTVPDGYEHEGTRRYANYVMSGTVGVVDQTRPFYAPKEKFNVAHKATYNTLDEAETRGDAIEADYLRRGWHRYHHVFTQME